MAKILLSNSIWKDGKLYPVFKKTFNLLALTNQEYKQKQAAFPEKNGLSSIWLPFLDDFRNELFSPSMEFVTNLKAFIDIQKMVWVESKHLIA